MDSSVGKLDRFDLLSGGRVECHVISKWETSTGYDGPLFKIYNASFHNDWPIEVTMKNMTTLLLVLQRIQKVAQQYQARLDKIPPPPPGEDVDEVDGPTPKVCISQVIVHAEDNQIVRAFILEGRNQVSLTIQAHRLSFADMTRLFADSGSVEISLDEDLDAVRTFVKQFENK